MQRQASTMDENKRKPLFDRVQQLAWDEAPFLYLVRFEQAQIWSGYTASSHDALFIDLYEHWLEPA